MTDHISYAMRNQEAIESFLSFNSPGSLIDWSHFFIEMVFLAGIVLAAVHAVRHGRAAGNRSALLTLLGAFLYGLVMDITSYYTVDSFWHGEFSVMLVFNRLPLYIIFLYPALIYHLIMIVRRFDFSPLVEAVSIGFFGGLMYLIFDNIGPQLGWWIWDRAAASNQPFVSSVPLTSYGWFFLYTGAFAWLSRKVCWDWPAEGRGRVQVLVGTGTLPITTIILGTLLFAPYSILARNVSPWNLMNYQSHLGPAVVLHLICFTAAGFTFVFQYRKPRADRDRLLMTFPLIYLASMTYLYIAKVQQFLQVSGDGLTPDGLAVGNPFAAVLAIIASMAIVLSAFPAPREDTGGVQ